MDALTANEHSVLMQMSGDFGYTAAVISANLAHEEPNEGWTARKVNKCQRSLHAKGFADFGHLMSDEDTLLRGRGYWLSAKGCAIRYLRILPPVGTE